MIAYTSRTGTKSTLDALRAHGWRLLVSAANDHRHEGMPFAIDNGAWTYHQRGERFDGGRFLDCLEQHGPQADFAVLPDVVGDARATLRQAEVWADVVASKARRALLALQDGMELGDVERFVPAHSRFGVFLGGTTTWKLRTLDRWGRWATERGTYLHVARVNSVRRVRAAAYAGADSFDGSGPVQFPSMLARLDVARREGTLVHGPARIDAPRDYDADAALVRTELPTYRDDDLVTLPAGALRRMLQP